MKLMPKIYKQLFQLHASETKNLIKKMGIEPE